MTAKSPGDIWLAYIPFVNDLGNATIKLRPVIVLNSSAAVLDLDFIEVTTHKPRGK